MRFALASELGGSADGSQNSDQSWDMDMAPQAGASGAGHRGRDISHLGRWAVEIERLAAPVHRTVYAYFNNDVDLGQG